jgi:adenosine/AMP kinase
MNLELVPVALPEGANVVIGQTHFIKTVEDLYEIVVTSVPQAHFGVAFNEASGPRLVRVEGNADDLRQAAAQTALAIGAGHVFVLFLRDAFPINVLTQIKSCAEVCHIFCATANPVEVILAETGQGRGILGVIDGEKTKGIETDKDVAERKALLRRFGYKAD